MENSTHIAYRVSVITLLENAALSVAKLAAGLIAHSGAMVSDAVHSVSDVFSTLVVMAGIRISHKESDKKHPFGHERLECVAAILLAGMLLATGAFIGYEGVEKIMKAREGALPVPGTLALIAAVVSIAVKEWMFHYTRRAAKKIDSGALMADAWHHRSDALSSIGALIGIGGAKLGYPVLDPIASLVICVMIAKAAIEIFIDAINKMVDESCDEETENAMRLCALRHPGIERVDSLLTRKFGNRIYVEMEVSVEGSLSLTAAHAIAEQVHDDIEREFPKVKHIMIHVNPAGEEGTTDVS